MLWVVFALSAAFFVSIYYVMNKYLIKRINLYIIPSGIFLIGSLILFTISLVKGIPFIGYLFLPAALISIILNVIAVIVHLKALKMADISLVIPMLSFTPIFLIFTSFIILGELSTTWGLLGIFFIFMGSYLLNLGGKGFLAPFRALSRNKAGLYMLLFAFIISLVANFDKIAVLNSDAVFAPAIIQFFIGATFFILSYKKDLKIASVYRKNIGFFALGGFGIAMAAFITLTAFTMQIVTYVMSIQRISILFTVLYGFLFFREKNIRQRLAGTVIMLIGATMIVVL